eukprot:1195291-Prorocentrum_minimum.AAC.5
MLLGPRCLGGSKDVWNSSGFRTVYALDGFPAVTGGIVTGRQVLEKNTLLAPHVAGQHGGAHGGTDGPAVGADYSHI